MPIVCLPQSIATGPVPKVLLSSPRAGAWALALEAILCRRLSATPFTARGDGVVVLESYRRCVRGRLVLGDMLATHGHAVDDNGDDEGHWRRP